MSNLKWFLFCECIELNIANQHRLLRNIKHQNHVIYWILLDSYLLIGNQLQIIVYVFFYNIIYEIEFMLQIASLSIKKEFLDFVEMCI